jgi:hypothetical protein
VTPAVYRDTIKGTVREELLVHIVIRFQATQAILKAVRIEGNVFVDCCIPIHGPGSVVGIATAYGLDGPGVESRWRRDFPHLPRPALRPTQPLVQLVQGLSRE